MFWKRLSIWFLILTFSVMMAAPSFAFNLASDSNADYGVDYFSLNPMAIAASDYTLSQYAYYTGNGNNVLMGSNPTVPANATRYFRNYAYTGNGDSLLLELSGFNINQVESVQIEYSGPNGWVGNRTVNDFRDYWVKLPNNANYVFAFPVGMRSGYGITIIINLKPNTPSFSVLSYVHNDAVYQSLDDLYVGESATKAKLYDIQLSSAQLPNTGFAILDNTNKTLGLRMLLDNDIWFYKGFEYSIVFNSYIPLEGIEFISSNQWLGSVANGYWGARMEKSGNRYVLTFTPTYNILANSITFSMVHSYNNSIRWFMPNVHVESVSSSYIPKSDTGSQGQTTAANTTIIKNMVTNINNTISNIQNTVSNISTQITNATTTITNTITNKVDQLQSSISSGLNNLGSTITGNADKNTDKITQSQKENTNKVIENQDKNTDKVTANQDKNTDTIVNGYDSSAIESENDRLSGKLDEFGKAEDEVIGQISKPLKEFEFHNPVVQYLSTFQLFGNFMQDVFTGSGAFKDVINMSFIMSIALLVAGLYRFKGGN